MNFVLQECSPGDETIPIKDMVEGDIGQIAGTDKEYGGTWVRMLASGLLVGLFGPPLLYWNNGRHTSFRIRLLRKNERLIIVGTG